MKVSVIIPIYNAEKYLDELFSCLLTNNFSSEDEILLVDNGSTDNSMEKCRKFATENYPLVKYLKFTEKAGSYCARNFAIDFATGDIFVFTDGDTKPSSKWISEIKKNILRGQIVAGRIKLEIVDHNIWEYYDAWAHLQSESESEKSHIATANMAVLKEDFDKVGKFEEQFSGGDYEWSSRASKNGLFIKYCPKVLVLHPTRKTFHQILNKEIRIAFGVGNEYKNHKKSKCLLVLLFILKILKIDTNIKYSILLNNEKFSLLEILKFNICFFKIRFKQLEYAVKGYNKENPRLMNLK